MRVIFLLFLFTFLLSKVNAQERYKVPPQGQHKISHLTSADGLSNNRVRVIIQDAVGFLWFGTQNGLNKYDGYSIKTYWPDPHDSTTVSSTLITSMLLDSRGKLWVAGIDGLDIYSQDFDNFTRFKDSISSAISSVYALAEDHYGTVWIGTDIGLFSYSLQSRKVNYFSSVSTNGDSLLKKGAYRLFADNQNRLWITVLNYGLCVYNIETSKFSLYLNNPDDPATISDVRIEQINQDINGDIWLGTMNNGLNKYDPENDAFIRITVDPEVSYSSRVTVMFNDLSGNFFVGTRAGLYMFDKNSGSFFVYASENHNFSKLSQNSINSFFIDNTGTLWIGTFSGGANYMNVNGKAIVHYIAGAKDKQFLSGPNIYPITEDPKGNLWIGTDNGLNFLDRSTYTFRYYTNDPGNPNSLSYNDVKALDWDKSGRLWIGTNMGGLNCLDVKRKNFTRFRHSPDDPGSISGDKVYGVLIDRSDNLWVICNQVSDRRKLCLDMLPAGKTEFIHLSEKPDFGIDEDREGNVYFGALNGFWIFNNTDSTFTLYRNDEFIENVNVLKKDSENGVWIGGTKGLVHYGLDDHSYKWFSKQTGFPISEVFGIVEDDNNGLWVSTASGLFQFPGIVKDISDTTYVRYDQQDGMQSDQFNYNSYYKCKSGEILFGGVNGFNTFFPDKLQKDTILAKVILTDLKISGTSVPIGEKVLGRVVLEKSISVTENLVLDYKHKILTIEFSTLQKNSPSKPLFRTRLVGLDDDWQYRSSGNNLVTYTNLAPGKYIFMVSAANNDGVWNPDPRLLTITVTTPFFREWWFKGALILLFLGMFVIFYYFRTRSVRKLNTVLENKVKNRTAEILEKNRLLEQANLQLQENRKEIIAQKEELEKHKNNLSVLVDERTADLKKALAKAKESDELKSAFFANMSHEIRTPMNAIVGFAGLLEKEGEDRLKKQKFVDIIKTNSRVLLKIIEEIIDLSVIESNQLIIYTAEFDLNVLIDNLYSYYSLNNSNQEVEIRVNNELEANNFVLKSDETRIRQIITNLMDNAVKFTGRGYIELGVSKSSHHLHIYVKDTGIGIPANALDTIFKRFTKIENNRSAFVQGLGLGLTISKNIAEILGGNLTVESEEGKGSRFVFSIPFDRIISVEKTIKTETLKKTDLNWSGKTILIAEDVEVNYLYLKIALEKTEVRILWAKDGREAIEIAEASGKIDVILMDIKMPGVDGLSAAKTIREKNPGQIIIAQTAYARPQEKLEFYNENFDEYITKPISYSELYSILGRFM
ncbi:MAG: two-component regulator propeller domain-containing protein [Bacteroidota bacterium]